jgi:multiple sugar transport system permease protein
MTAEETPTVHLRPGRDAGSLGTRREFSGRLHRAAPFILPAPAAITIALLCAFPAVYTLYMSFQAWTGSQIRPPEFVGLLNYLEAFRGDERFQAAIWRTLLYTVGSLALQLPLGVALAVFFNREFLGKGLVRTLFLLPFVATPAAIALVWVLIYNPATGVLNYLLGLVHLPAGQWTYGADSALWALVIVDTWQHTPLVMLIALAGLAALPQDPYESAQIDGANPWQSFWHITLPLLRPTVAVAALFRAIDALKAFDVIYAMTQGGPGEATETLNIYIYLAAFQYFRFGYSSSLLMLFFTLILAVCLLIIKGRRQAGGVRG